MSEKEKKTKEETESKEKKEEGSEENPEEEKEKKKEPEKEKSKDRSDKIISAKAKAIADKIMKGSLGTPIFPSKENSNSPTFDSPGNFSQMQKKIDSLTRENERMAQRLQLLDTEKAKDLQDQIAKITNDWEKPISQDEMEDWTYPETQSVFEFVQRYRSKATPVKDAKDKEEKPEPRAIKRGFLPIIPPVKDEAGYDPSGHTFFIDRKGSV
jgi:hypothetical protein